MSGTDWFNHLPLVLLGLWSVLRDDSAISASEALFVFSAGVALRVSG